MRFEAVKVHPNMMEIITGMYPRFECLRFGLKFAAKVPIKSVNVWPCSVGTHPILMIYVQNQSPKHFRVSKLPPQCMHMHACTPPSYRHTCWHALRKQIHAYYIHRRSHHPKYPKPKKSMKFQRLWVLDTPKFPPPYPKKVSAQGPKFSCSSRHCSAPKSSIHRSVSGARPRARPRQSCRSSCSNSQRRPGSPPPASAQSLKPREASRSGSESASSCRVGGVGQLAQLVLQQSQYRLLDLLDDLRDAAKTYKKRLFSN